MFQKSKKRDRLILIGLDEAGRGSLAGPVVAAAVMIKNSKLKISNHKQIRNQKFRSLKRVLNFSHWKSFEICNLEFGFFQNKIKDSKKLSPQKREKIYQTLKNCPEIKWGRGVVNSKIIDKINILEATKLAMKKAVKNLQKKIKKKLHPSKTILIIDGNQKIESGYFEIPIIKADEKIFLCACASIIAKVNRDALMKKYDKKFPHYRFSIHKGYPTKIHKNMIKQYGLSLIHRKSFRFK